MIHRHPRALAAPLLAALFPAVLAAVLAPLAACVPQQSRLGMVADAETGLMYGSTIENNLVADPTFYNNRKLKIRTRNTSGDIAFDLTKFARTLADQYAAKGFTPTSAEDFGLLLDVNVLYSGHIQSNYATQFGFLGAAAGGAYGERGGRTMGPLVGTVAGATVGALAGAYVSEDTYMIVANITFGVIKKAKTSQKRVSFSRSEKIKNIDDPDEEEEVYNRGFKKSYSTQLAVYAGGRNVAQAEIAEGVRQRIARVLGDFL